MKVEKPKDQNGATLNTYDWICIIYKHDASGNTMANYTMKLSFEGMNLLRETYYLSEQNIYGSSRIGMIKSNTEIAYRVFDGVFTGGLGGGVVNNGYTDGSTPAQITDYITPTDYETDGTGGFYTDMRGDCLFEGKKYFYNFWSCR